MNEKRKYQSIRDWGRMLGSYQYYIDGQIAEAEQDGAPEDAIFKNGDGTWATVADIVSQDTLRAMGLPALQ